MESFECEMLKQGFNGLQKSGPGKTREELEFAVEKHIHIINIESLEELKLVNTIAEEHNCWINVTISVNPEKSKINAKRLAEKTSKTKGLRT